MKFCNFRYIGSKDSVTISVWNHKKIHKKPGAGFLGCVRIMSNAIQQLKDTGCKLLLWLIILPDYCYHNVLVTVFLPSVITVFPSECSCHSVLTSVPIKCSHHSVPLSVFISVLLISAPITVGAVVIVW